MGRKKKTDLAPADGTTPPPATHNGLSDDDLQVLTFQHKRAYEGALALKKKHDADFKNVCKKAKAELGKNAVETIKIMIELETDEGELEIKGRIERAMQAARWMGASLGTQFTLFGDTGDTVKEFEEGKRVGLAGDPCKPPFDGSSPAYQKWINGWHRGQELKAQNFAGPETNGLSRKDWAKQMAENSEDAANKIKEAATEIDQRAPIGTEPPTHTVEQ